LRSIQLQDREIIPSRKRCNFPIVEAVIAGFFYYQLPSLLFREQHYVPNKLGECTVADRFCRIKQSAAIIGPVEGAVAFPIYRRVVHLFLLFSNGDQG
jgi:hypothetical protein